MQFDRANLPAYVDVDIAEKARLVIDTLRIYHRHKVIGMEHIPTKGPALLVVNHRLATYDIMMLGFAIFEQTGRLARALADRLIFQLAPLRRIVVALGGVEGAPDAASNLLRAGELVMVAPGGMREALRPSQKRYTTSWEGRLGFARLAIGAQVPVVVAACPAADDLYTLYDNRLTNFVLRNFHFPIPLVRGIGPTLVPRRYPLTHTISAPIQPPQAAPSDTDAARAFAQKINGTMQQMLQHPR